MARTARIAAHYLFEVRIAVRRSRRSAENRSDAVNQGIAIITKTAREKVCAASDHRVRKHFVRPIRAYRSMVHRSPPRNRASTKADRRHGISHVECRATGRLSGGQSAKGMVDRPLAWHAIATVMLFDDPLAASTWRQVRHLCTMAERRAKGRALVVVVQRPARDDADLRPDRRMSEDA